MLVDGHRHLDEMTYLPQLTACRLHWQGVNGQRVEPSLDRVAMDACLLLDVLHLLCLPDAIHHLHIVGSIALPAITGEC